MSRRLPMLLLLAIAPAWGQQILFHAPLTDGPDATVAAGTKGAVCRHAARDTGFWSIRDAQDIVGWMAEGNLDKRHGTLSLWVKPAWDPADRASGIIVCDDITFSDKGSNAFRLWKWDDRCLRLDLRSPEDKYIPVPFAKCPPGVWHHLAVTWDEQIGTRFYIDGQRVGAAEYAYTAYPAKWLYLGGSDDREGPAAGDYKDLLILDQALSDSQVADLATGQVSYPNAPARSRPTTTPTPRPATAKPVFRVDFEGQLKAGTAIGKAEPRASTKVTFVASPFGQAAHFDDGAVLEYDGANVPHDRGAISLWVRPDWSADQAGGDRTIFREAPPDSAGDDCRWIWFWNDAARLRFDLRTPGDPYVNVMTSDWQPGSWHHLVLCWDAATGDQAQYVDGRRILSRGDSRKIFVRDPWQPKPKTHFWIGSQNGQKAARAAIDQVVIYDAPLSDQAVVAEYASLAPLTVTVAQPYLEPGAREAEVIVTNRSGSPLDDAVLTAERSGARGGVTSSLGRLAAGEVKVAQVALPVGATGDWVIQASAPGKQSGPAGQIRVCSPVPPPAKTAGEKLVATIDLTKLLPADQYTDTGDVKTVDSPLGKYREAGTNRGSRFAVRLSFADLGAWHRIEWDWPDDKPRTTDAVLNGDKYDVATGMLAGDEYPNWGELRTQWCWCWPRTKNDAIVFMTAEAGRPAAVSAVRVYQLDGPPPAVMVPPVKFQSAEPRRVGLYYEDPVLPMNFGGRPDFPDFANVADRLLAYLDATGLNSFYYPAVWYHGPLYPSASQGADQLGSRPHPNDFLRYLLRMFEARGIKLMVTFNVHDLPEFAEAQANEEAVRAGAETPVTTLWNGALKTSGWHGSGGDFNPLDPQVRDALGTLVKELAERYGDSPAFGGVCLHLPMHSMLWFGQLEGGYNDRNLKAFQADSGVDLKLDWDEPLRANQAYRELTGPHREQWIDWRCRQIAKQWSGYAEALRSKRPDLELAVNLYTVLDEMKNQQNVAPEEVDFVESARICGADVRLLSQIPNVRLMNTFAPGLYRWTRSRRAPFAPIQREQRTACFSPSAYIPFAALGKPFDVNLHDKYWEDDVGRTRGLNGMQAWDQREMGWRVSTLVPPSPDCLENYAEALGEADIQTMTKGGFVVGTVGMEDSLRGWALAFRQLPQAPFEDLPGLDDPVRVRVCHRPDGEWAYVQNRLRSPVAVTLKTKGQGELRDLAAGTAVDGALRLSGFGLVALWSPAGGRQVTGATVTGTEPVAEALKRRLDDLAAKPGAAAEEAKARIALAREELAAGHLARVGYMLDEVWEARFAEQPPR